MKPDRLFSEDGKKAIEAAIVRAEARTSGEIVPIVVEASDAYPHVTLAAAVVGQMIALAAGVWILPAPDYLAILGLIAGGLAVGTLAGRFVAPVRRLLLGAKIAEAEVYQRAVQAFHELGVSKTRDRTGVLLFVSLFERRVQVLADVGIAERTSEQTWKAAVEATLAGVRAGDLAAGIAAGVDAIGEVLAAHFPPRPDDVNELPDDVVIN